MRTNQSRGGRRKPTVINRFAEDDRGARRHRAAGPVPRRNCRPLDLFNMRVRTAMREHPAHAVDYRNELIAHGFDLLDAATSNRRRTLIQAALDVIDPAFKRHIDTYRDPAATGQEAA